jgi:hypothetical protein
MKFMKFIFSLFFSFVLLNACAMFLTACSGCDLNSINNGSATPSDYNIGFSGTAIAAAVKQQMSNPSVNRCDPSQDMANVRVIIKVRTAMTDASGAIVLNPKVYFEKDLDDVEFFSKEKNTKINIDVPSTGSFGIVVDIELPDCSNCCNAIASGLEVEQQCYKLNESSSRTSTNNGVTFICKTGKPKLNIEAIYTPSNRPDTRSAFDDLNIRFKAENMLVRSCRSCTSCTNICN